MDLAEKHGVNIVYNQKCTDIDLKTATVTFEETESGKTTTVKSDRVFSTDGAFSSGRMQMQTSTDRFNYSQTYLEHGYKELTIPPTAAGEFAMDPNCLHIWPRGQFMLIALPNMDKTFTCTLFFPFEGQYSFASLDTEQKMLDFFRKTFPDAFDLMPTLKEDYFQNPTSSLMIVKCYPWTFSDKMAMVGDSAHAIVPFYGQGMNCGFEDCVVMNQLIDKYLGEINGDDDSAAWQKIFNDYQVARKPDGDAIADLAVMNFIEMRDKTGDPKFLLQKKIEAWFSDKHPDKWIPLYSMVTYSPHIRYSEALREGLRQESIMQQVMRMSDIENKWNSEDVEKKILEFLK
jgi:kynurenine 3-monooxygenase